MLNNNLLWDHLLLITSYLQHLGRDASHQSHIKRCCVYCDLESTSFNLRLRCWGRTLLVSREGLQSHGKTIVTYITFVTYIIYMVSSEYFTFLYRLPCLFNFSLTLNGSNMRCYCRDRTEKNAQNIFINDPINGCFGTSLRYTFGHGLVITNNLCQRFLCCTIKKWKQ